MRFYLLFTRRLFCAMRGSVTRVAWGGALSLVSLWDEEQLQVPLALPTKNVLTISIKSTDLKVAHWNQVPCVLSPAATNQWPWTIHAQAIGCCLGQLLGKVREKGLGAGQSGLTWWNNHKTSPPSWLTSCCQSFTNRDIRSPLRKIQPFPKCWHSTLSDPLAHARHIGKELCKGFHPAWSFSFSSVLPKYSL